jgi:hypothetical protein
MLSEKRAELRDSMTPSASVIWPLIVKTEDMMLVDGYCRYATLKAMNVSKTLAYVGRLWLTVCVKQSE